MSCRGEGMTLDLIWASIWQAIKFAKGNVARCLDIRCGMNCSAGFRATHLSTRTQRT